MTDTQINEVTTATEAPIDEKSNVKQKKSAAGLLFALVGTLIPIILAAVCFAKNLIIGILNFVIIAYEFGISSTEAVGSASLMPICTGVSLVNFFLLTPAFVLISLLAITLAIVLSVIAIKKKRKLGSVGLTLSIITAVVIALFDVILPIVGVLLIVLLIALIPVLAIAFAFIFFLIYMLMMLLGGIIYSIM